MDDYFEKEEACKVVRHGLWLIGVLFLVFSNFGCMAATPLKAIDLSYVEETRAVFPPNYSVAYVLTENRTEYTYTIKNQYGMTLHVMQEGQMFEEAVASILTGNFGDARPLREDTKANLLVILEGRLDINTLIGSYKTKVWVKIMKPDGEEIGGTTATGEEASGRIDDENAIYNAYLKTLNVAIQKILGSIALSFNGFC